MDKTTKLIIIRHGQSLGNATRTFLGHTDKDLSELGYNQALATAEHLKNGRLSIKEIAAECGFAEQNYFSKAFSKKYGCSPSEFRKIRN